MLLKCKGWRLSKLIDEKYTTKNQLLIIEKKPSLKKKVDYVKNNQQKFIHNIPMEIIGLIVTIGYPPIKEFDGIKMISRRDSEFKLIKL